MKTAFVIGSGIAGLSIAEILSRNGFKVIVLEAQCKIGGEASLATQKWYHTGWLYAALRNKAAMMGCYNAACMYKEIYGEILPNDVLNIDVNDNGITNYNTMDGWFIDEKILYLYALSTYDMSILLKVFWPFYLKMFPFRRLRNLKYNLDVITKLDNKTHELMSMWEDDKNGYKKYKVVRSTDSKINTERVTRSLVSIFSSNTEILTNSKFSLRENKNETEIVIDESVHKPDYVILASGQSVPTHLRDIGYEKLAEKITSIKSPILVLKKEMGYPDFIRFTPNVNHTINHIKFPVEEGKRISTIGSFYSLSSKGKVDISYYEDLMCAKMGITRDDVMGSYFGIKTEFVGRADRRYNHALEKVNLNTFFALAGKFSQFPLLVHDFVQKTGLSLAYNNPFNKIKINNDLFAHSVPFKIASDSKKLEDC